MLSIHSAIVMCESLPDEKIAQFKRHNESLNRMIACGDEGGDRRSEQRHQGGEVRRAAAAGVGLTGSW